ncbi:MAG TPA: hypothetical protein PLE42_06775 [Candidatus Competibacteraceae bacterium]|nr:hypothetical protein [Candidatus Competibacteraceae bacterium]
MPKKAGSTDSTTKKTNRKPAARKSAPVVETPAAVETVTPAAVVKAEPVTETVAVAEPVVAEPAAVKAVAEPVTEAVAEPVVAEPAATEPVAEVVAEPVAAPAPTEKRMESTVTVVVAKYDVGFGNSLYIRGEGAGLSWEAGILMENVGNDVWVWTTSEIADEDLAFKFLVNDESWSAGDNLSAALGETTTLYPCF